jgi:1-acyl-sn-glycerol-3-phosphate acyltransferase
MMDSNALTPYDRSSLRWQTLLGWLAFPIVGPGSVTVARWLNGNRVEGLEAARSLYRAARASGRPTIVCANHLTMVDSVYLHYALAPLRDYLRDFTRFSWNVPAVENYCKNPFLRLLVYLGKTIPIDREGDDAHRKGVIEKIKYLVANGDVCTLFPEGQRSRTGRVDTTNVTYGIGQILRDLDKPQVICAYLRGERQDSFSALPERGDILHLSVELLEPKTRETGLRATRDLSRQVIQKLKQMEDAFFARCKATEGRFATVSSISSVSAMG